MKQNNTRIDTSCGLRISTILQKLNCLLLENGFTGLSITIDFLILYSANIYDRHTL